jgi:hypothetical protein
MPNPLFVDYCHEAYFQRTSPSYYEKTGAEYQDIDEIFSASDSNGYDLQCPVSLLDDF